MKFAKGDLRRGALAFVSGGVIAVLAGLIGLGGAEFRLPVLISGFRFPLRRAIPANLIISLITVSFALLFRAPTLPLPTVFSHSPSILGLLAGSLFGSAVGVQFASRASERALKGVVIALLVLLSFALIGHDFIIQGTRLMEPGSAVLWVAGTLSGAMIGIVSSLLGVAGGELIIPTLILLYGIDIKVAGSLSLAISVPTILVGLVRYARKGLLAGLGAERIFLGGMGVGSILGSWVGSSLVPIAPQAFLQFLLGMILLFSAFRLARERHTPKAKPIAETASH